MLSERAAVVGHAASEYVEVLETAHLWVLVQLFVLARFIPRVYGPVPLIARVLSVELFTYKRVVEAFTRLAH